jgi:hypothetical protein
MRRPCAGFVEGEAEGVREGEATGNTAGVGQGIKSRVLQSNLYPVHEVDSFKELPPHSNNTSNEVRSVHLKKKLNSILKFER